MTQELLLFSFLRTIFCENFQSKITKEQHTSEMLDAVYILAQKHDLAHLVACALEKLDLPDCEALAKFKTAKMRAIYRYARLEYEYERICAALEAAQIPFIPLKGSVIRQYYPEPWMRTSCDIDILVPEKDLKRAVDMLVEQEWKMKDGENYHDISLFSPSGVHLELHFHIKENIQNIDKVLEKVWEHSYLLPGKQYEYRQTDEFLMFHLFAHMSYHFLRGGCGIRSVLDIWLLKNHIEYDEKMFRELCSESGLDKFCDSVFLLAKVWFENAEPTEVTKYMASIIMNGGTYGSFQNRVSLQQAQAGGKSKHIFRRMFMPYHQIIVKYPVLKKHKYLIPLFQIVRWVQLLFNGKLRRALTELQMTQVCADNEMKKTEDLLDEIGLRQFK